MISVSRFSVLFLILISILFMSWAVSVFAFSRVSPSSELTYLYSYSYPASEYPSEILNPLGIGYVSNDQPEFPSPDGSGIVSVSVFSDELGVLHYVNIPNEDYVEMGRESGEDYILTAPDALYQILKWQE